MNQIIKNKLLYVVMRKDDISKYKELAKGWPDPSKGARDIKKLRSSNDLVSEITVSVYEKAGDTEVIFSDGEEYFDSLDHIPVGLAIFDLNGQLIPV